MCPAHHPRPVASFQNLDFANSATTLPATDGNPAFETDLGTTEDRLIIGARKYVGPLAVVTIFDLNLKSHFSASRRLRDPALFC